MCYNTINSIYFVCKEEAFMDKVVDKGYKIDLHIHSIYSNGKDGGKVSFNTIDNIDKLAQKLSENGVHICAITDHDAFGYEMYKALKQYEHDDDYSIVKVLPGIEFSVEFNGNDGGSVVHVIAVFDDSDDVRISKIQDALKNDDGVIAYDRNMAFSEERFLAILREIGLDTILIAHQKNSLTSATKRKSDANTVGTERFKEFIYTDFFEAFEFKNKRNEIFNKSFLAENGLSADLRFITGTDCHDWNWYPHENSADKSNYRFTYVKCLPTFRGLVMAITDYRRIKTVNSFFNPSETYLNCIKMKIRGQEVEVPLSRGINVIIGDNSIGKSLLLHKITGYIKKKTRDLPANIAKSYDQYLKKNDITIYSHLDEEEIFAFDMQGELRKKFEEDKIKSDEFLKKYYPGAVDSSPYREIVQRELNKVFGYLREKFEIEELEKKLGKFQIIDEDTETAESLSFVGIISRDNVKVKGLSDVSSQSNDIAEKVRSLQNNKWVEEEDKLYLAEIEKKMRELSKKYDERKEKINNENIKIGLFRAVIEKYKQHYNSSISDLQKKVSSYHEAMNNTVEKLAELKIRQSRNKKPSVFIERKDIEILTNRVFEYEFNSRLCINLIDTDYVMDVLQCTFKNGTKKSVLDMTQKELSDAMTFYDYSENRALDEFIERIRKRLDEDFKEKYTITQKGRDRTEELSSGFNSKIYFDLLSYESNHKGIYIIDQPEDNISQKSIREYLLDRFKVMGENRQVIIVTHNPQFIVNLDVDNVIFIGRNENGIIVQSGALEFKSDEYSILDIVSNNIEGGLDTLKRRWKRYEKNNQI